MDLAGRARGALWGLAVGDALGMPTQSLPRSLIVERYGELVDDLHPGPDDHPIAAGLPAGRVTDDTEQALLLADLLVAGAGRVDARTWAQRLLRWEERMRARGSLDLLGPSTRRALDELLAGADPRETGRRGDTNGAAMRITPVGVATPSGDAGALAAAVTAASAVTHNTGLALAGAAAVAGAVSSALDGADLRAATDYAVAAAERAAGLGHWAAGAHVARRITRAVQLVGGSGVQAAIAMIDAEVGTSLHVQESVPAAFAAVHVARGDPWLACRIGASVGGDCDTIAAMAGAIAGALNGAEALPETARARVAAANDLPIDALADGLLALRAR